MRNEDEKLYDRECREVVSVKKGDPKFDDKKYLTSGPLASAQKLRSSEGPTGPFRKRFQTELHFSWLAHLISRAEKQVTCVFGQQAQPSKDSARMCIKTTVQRNICEKRQRCTSANRQNLHRCCQDLQRGHLRHSRARNERTSVRVCPEGPTTRHV